MGETEGSIWGGVEGGSELAELRLRLAGAVLLLPMSVG